jgi:hypothetical protein
VEGAPLEPNPTRQRIYNAIAVLVIVYVLAISGAMAILVADRSHPSRLQFRLACNTVRVLTFHTLACGPNVQA